MVEIDHSRRRFFFQAGSLTIGFSLQHPWSYPGFLDSVQEDLPGSLRGYPSVDSWLQVLENNRIRVFTGKVELGQGIGIVIRQVAAEELGCELDQVEVVHADTERTPNEGYTAGSGSVKSSAMAVRYAAAFARQKILEKAALKGKIPLENLELNNGVIMSIGGKKITTIAELLFNKKWQAEVKLPVALKAKKDYQYVGKELSGNQLIPTITGKTYFINDLKFPDMVHARTIKPDAYQALIKSIDEEKLRQSLPENVELLIDGSFVAVLGNEEFRVIKAAKELAKKLEWTIEDFPAGVSDMKTYMVNAATESKVVIQTDNEEMKGVRRVVGSFFKPYIMHGSMAPACGIARYAEGQLTVWTHSQGIYPFREALAALTGLSIDKIRMISVPGAGCFGHNSSDDAAAEAAIIALKKPGHSIRVQWSRKDEHRWEALGSAMRMDITASISSEDKIVEWKSDVWTDSHSLRPNSDAGTLLVARFLANPVQLQGRGYLGGGYRNAEPYYQIPVKDIVAHFFEGPLRVSSLRSLGAYANIFAIESIVDELARLTSLHPIEFRIKNLEDDRAVEVLRTLKEMTSRVSLAEREGIGYAFGRYKNNDGYCAVAAQVSIDDQQRVKIIHLWAAADVGEVMNALGMKKQVEGGMLQSASWTLMESVRFDENQIISDDWIRYPMMQMRESPQVSVTLINRPDEPALGGGELSVPPTPAAITNAIFQVTGKRIYDLPIKPSRRG
ncbi:MAG: xanthine dehydrogenase family protein molybdopterin-binding subunit [Saprospiraceae bacterium]|nr:xanthine dehydrogenase family protein molybdopterin-binding subunit [Saprospiraceae bacterium]